VTLLAAGSAATLAHAPALVSFVPASAKTEVAREDVVQGMVARSFRAVPVAAAASSATSAGKIRAVAANVYATAASTDRQTRAVEVMARIPEATPAAAPRALREPRAVEAVAHGGAAQRGVMDGPAKEDAEDAGGETVIRQGVATASDGTVTAWYVEAHFAAPSTAATANIEAQPKPVRAQHPVYRPAYAIPTPNGWLVLEL
jgi:hypothetical protein